jgi:hypothetical protein
MVSHYKKAEPDEAYAPLLVRAVETVFLTLAALTH